jgi:predicted DNA-binding transcriptional regulator YafY
VGRNDQQVRVSLLLRSLMNASGVRVVEFAQRHGIHERTVRRDLAALERTGHPIWQSEPGRYQIDASKRSLKVSPVTALTADELIAIGAARAGAAQWRKTKLGRALETAWCKLSVQAMDDGEASPPTASLTFGEHLGINYDRYHKIIATIEAAIANRVAITCRYRRIRGGEQTDRIIEPGALHVDPALDSLYLIAFCRLRNDIRVFAIHRFVSAATVDSPIPKRPELRTAAALHGAFRIWREQTVTSVHLRFFGDAAAHVAERVVHKSQRIVRHPDQNGADLFFEVAGTQEVLRWLLGYGSAVQVLAPAALADAHLAELRDGAGRYEQQSQKSKPARTSAVREQP